MPVAPVVLEERDALGHEARGAHLDGGPGGPEDLEEPLQVPRLLLAGAGVRQALEDHPPGKVGGVGVLAQEVGSEERRLTLSRVSAAEW